MTLKKDGTDQTHSGPDPLHQNHARPTWNQAHKVIKRLGGPYETARLLGISPSTVYRWCYGRPDGTDGLIPASRLATVAACARLHGIVLTPTDWTPERISYEEDPL